MENSKRIFQIKIMFFFILIGVVLPLVILPLDSWFYHQLYKAPFVEAGILNLNGYNLAGPRGLPLDGLWEFYPGEQIVSKGRTSNTPGRLVPVPRPWHMYPQTELKNRGIGSYRMVLKNCPPDLPLAVYIPNIKCVYKIFLDGKLTASRGFFSDDGEGSEDASNPFEREITAGSDGEVEMVIEIGSRYIGGLYMTPLLAEVDAAHERADARAAVSYVMFGMMITAMLFIMGLLVMRNKLVFSWTLLGMDAVVFIRILFLNENVAMHHQVVPTRAYLINTLLQIITQFLPFVFFFCVREALHIEVRQQDMKKTAIYEIIFAPFILASALWGRTHLVVLLCLLSYLPLITVMRILYRCIKKDTPYALLVSIVLMLVTSCMLGSTLYRFGLLVMDISLFPTVCFTIALLVQLWIFILRGIDVQRQAMESENLRLRLHESEANLMLSQIKPHFLYNTLIAIHMLCTQEPETAAETTLKFATFLRTNMNFISSKGLIPFEKELDHIRNYVDIEELRYQKRLEVRYEISATDFRIPPLSIQPLVENAIRHGVCKNVKGGTVVLSTSVTDEGYLVKITDNGPGFDPSMLESAEQEMHGLQNIRFRLRAQRGAEVAIKSGRDLGTTVTVMIPKEEANEGVTVG